MLIWFSIGFNLVFGGLTAWTCFSVIAKILVLLVNLLNKQLLSITKED